VPLATSFLASCGGANHRLQVRICLQPLLNRGFAGNLWAKGSIAGTLCHKQSLWLYPKLGKRAMLRVA